LTLPPHTFGCYIRYADGRKPPNDKATILNIKFFDKTQFPPYHPVALTLEQEVASMLPNPPKKQQKPFKKDRNPHTEEKKFGNV
jgi:hypothetical protein